MRVIILDVLLVATSECELLVARSEYGCTRAVGIVRCCSCVVVGKPAVTHGKNCSM